METSIMPKNILRVAIIVGLMLLIPLFGTLFVEGWNWGFFDFVAMGALLFGTGVAIDFAARKITNPTYRTLAIVMIVIALVAIWTELAVDAVSQLIHFLFA